MNAQKIGRVAGAIRRFAARFRRPDRPARGARRVPVMFGGGRVVGSWQVLEDDEHTPERPPRRRRWLDRREVGEWRRWRG
jgi:hypothetical protein